MVRVEDITQRRKLEAERLDKLKGLIKGLVSEDIRLIEGHAALRLSIRSDDEDIASISLLTPGGVLRDPGFKDTMEEIGRGYEKIYGFDGKDQQFLIETDYS
ncbi:MAG: hypothetical protein V1788_00960 [Nanoarchaeota archaeon]